MTRLTGYGGNSGTMKVGAPVTVDLHLERRARVCPGVGHGIYDVAKHFYNEFLPEVKEACEKAGQEHLYQEIIDKYINSDPRHVWYTQGFDPKKIEEMKKYYKDRYNQNLD